jgi:hypothetical protein
MQASPDHAGATALPRYDNQGPIDLSQKATAIMRTAQFITSPQPLTVDSVMHGAALDISELSGSSAKSYGLHRN